MPKLTAATQELCLALLCYDEVGGKTIRSIIQTTDYDPYFKEIAEAAENFWNRFGQPPKNHLQDIVADCKEKHPRSAELIDHVFQSVVQTWSGGVNKDFVIEGASAFARRQKIKQASTKMAMMLQESDDDSVIDEAGKLITNAFKTTNHLFDVGLKLSDPAQALSFLDHGDDAPFRTGIKEFDALGIGPARKTMLMFMATTNKGKTWAVCSMGKAAIMDRKRVLHITLEMSAKKVMQRYIQCLFSITRRDAKVLVQRFKTDELGYIISFDEDELKDRPHFKDPKIRAFLEKKLSHFKQRPPLIVKEFPTSMLTVRGLESYLDQLEAVEGFIPDEIIIDYPDLMATDTANYRHSIGAIYQQIRGIGVQRNAAMVVPTQGNREGLKVKTLRAGQVSEDISKYNISDTVITYSQTDSEYELGLARLFGDKVREEAKNISVLISQGYAMGQFCVDSALMAKVYWDKIEAFESDGKPEEEGDD